MDNIDECALCFAELGVDGAAKRAFLPCGCKQFCEQCVAQLKKECPLCCTALVVQPEPLLLHFNFMTGKRLHETCHPDETLRVISMRWEEFGVELRICFAGKTLNLDTPIASLPLQTGHTLHVVLKLRSD